MESQHGTYCEKVEVLAVFKTSLEMCKPRIPGNALQDDLFLEDERIVSWLQSVFPDCLQRIEAPVHAMLDQRDCALCAAAQSVKHLEISRSKARGKGRADDARSCSELEI